MSLSVPATCAPFTVEPGREIVGGYSSALFVYPGVLDSSHRWLGVADFDQPPRVEKCCDVCSSKAYAGERYNLSTVRAVYSIVGLIPCSLL